MSITYVAKRVLAGVLMSSVGAITALGFSTFVPGLGTANAEVRCDPVCHGTWCPGDPVYWQIEELVKTWDNNVCHEFHQVSGGVYAEGPLPPGTFVCPPFAFMCP